MTNTDLKLPPHNDELEQAILGGVLLDPSALDEVLDLLEPEMFYRPEHQEIWTAVKWLVSKSKAVDAATVWDAASTLDGEYLLSLVENSRGTANLSHYAKLVRDKAIARQLISTARQIEDIAFRSDSDVEDMLHKAQGMIMQVGTEDGDDLVHADMIARRVVEEIDRRFHQKGVIGLSSYFDAIDEKCTGFEPGNLIVVAGRPSMGKTTIAMNMAERAAIDGKVVLVFSCEMPSDSLLMRAYSSISDIHFAKLRRGALNEPDWPELTRAVAKLKGKDLYIDDTPAITTSQMRSKARRLQRRVGRPIDLIVVDYIQIMGDQVDGNDTARVSFISRNLKAIAKEFNCPLIALSQLNRGVEARNNKRPIMADLRDSGAVEQDADVVILMYREEYYNEHTHLKNVGEAIIAKQRNGPTGTAYLRAELEHMRFVDYRGQVPAEPERANTKNDEFEKVMGW